MMKIWIDIALILVLLVDFYLLAATRLVASIKALAFQGIVLGFLALFASTEFTIHTVILPLGSLVIKGVVIPAMLLQAIRKVRIRKEIEPFCSQTASLGMGTLIVLLSFYFSQNLTLPISVASRIWIPTAFSSVMIGLTLLVSRKKALTQVLAYVVLENGIYIFGLALANQMPLLVELGVLLDVFAGVFIMGIIMNQINTVFDDLDVDNMTLLKD